MYLAIDVETGGIGLDKSLLTVALIIADKGFVVTDRLLFAVKPDDGTYHVTAEGMAINKIDLIAHDKIAVFYKDTKTPAYKFLEKYGTKNRLTVVGKNVAGDLGHIWQRIVRQECWENFCSHHVCDLTSIWKTLQIAGKIHPNAKSSLIDMCEYLGIEDKPDHTAEKDALMSLECFKRLLSVIGTGPHAE